MKEAFYEESVSSSRAAREAKLYTAFRVVSIVLFVLAAVQIPIALSNISMAVTAYTDPPEGVTPITGMGLAYNIIVWVLYLALLAGAGLLFFFLKKRFNVSYDYVFVQDELRVSKVFNGRKRKLLRTFSSDQILKMGKCDSDSFERTCAGFDKKQIRLLTPNKQPSEGKEFYYVLYSTSIEKAVYILEARQELMEYMIFAAGRQKWEAR